MASTKQRAQAPQKGTLPYYEQQSNSARIFLFTVLAFTVVNLVLLFTSSDEDITIFLFSVWLPMDQLIGALAMMAYGMNFTLPLIIALAFSVTLLLSAILWKKSPAWPIVAFVLYLIDTIYAFAGKFTENVGYFYPSEKVLIFHVVIAVLLGLGMYNAVRASQLRKNAPQTAPNGFTAGEAAQAEAPAAAPKAPEAVCSSASYAEDKKRYENYKGPEL